MAGIKLVFENSTFQDLVKKVVNAAPTSGIAFDMTPGVCISYYYDDDLPEHDVVTFRATNGDLFYTEWTQPLSVEGDITATSWLVSSNLLAAVASNLPIGTTKQCVLTVDDTGNFLELTSGSIRCRMPLNSKVDSYPDFGTFDPDEVEFTTALAERIARVSWACAAGAAVPLNGVHFTGKLAIATDRFKVCITPLDLKVEQPFTIPSVLLGQLIKANGGESAKAAYFNGRLAVMPSDDVQIQVASYATEYPNVSPILVHEHTHNFKIGKSDVLEILKRVSSLVARERIPAIQLYVGMEQLAVIARDETGSILRDVLDIPSFATHDRVLYTFTPAFLIDSIENAPGNEVKISYYAEKRKGSRPNWHIEGDAGYQVWVQTRVDEMPTRPEGK